MSESCPKCGMEFHNTVEYGEKKWWCGSTSYHQSKACAALAAATKRAEEAEAAMKDWASPYEAKAMMEIIERERAALKGCRDLIATQRSRLAAAEQENARLREGIESMCRVMEALTYADISRHWAMNRLAALLAKPEGSDGT